LTERASSDLENPLEMTIRYPLTIRLIAMHNLAPRQDSNLRRTV